MPVNHSFPTSEQATTPRNLSAPGELEEELSQFCQFGPSTRRAETVGKGRSGRAIPVPTYLNEFWTSRQRAANHLHEVSYRACFKPQLPRFFIERLTRPGDRVYDPFMGRGTTPLEAALLGRIGMGCDANPLSAMLIAPRLEPPRLEEVAVRLQEMDLSRGANAPEELQVFYHPETLRQLVSLRETLMKGEAKGHLTPVDRWIRMVAITRLTGHSNGFFSVYTLPPNQAVSLDSQRKINRVRNQAPPPRDVPRLILSKSRSLLSGVDDSVRSRLKETAAEHSLLTKSAAHTPEIPSSSTALIVTSPPFLDVVDYATDNWLRNWFCGIDPKGVSLTVPRSLDEWKTAMTAVFVELARVLRSGGHIAFEVGEIRGGRIKLEETVIPCGMDAGLTPRLVLINDQAFTKTSNLWGVDNGRKGTNSNRVVLFRKE